MLRLKSIAYQNFQGSGIVINFVPALMHKNSLEHLLSSWQKSVIFSQVCNDNDSPVLYKVFREKVPPTPSPHHCKPSFSSRCIEAGNISNVNLS